MLWRECDFIRPMRGTRAAIDARLRDVEIAGKSLDFRRKRRTPRNALPTPAAEMWRKTRNKQGRNLFPSRCMQFSSAG
jgi:hypothetical protein